MEAISTFLTMAVGYILKGAAQSKTADTEKNSCIECVFEIKINKV